MGELRLAFAGALLASRRGDRDRAHALLAEAEARPVDPLHRWFLDRATAESHLALGEWAGAAEVAERALARDATALWQARFVMLGTAADVELALDARARRELVDPDATAARLRGRIDAARVAAVTGQGTEEAPDSAAHLAHAAIRTGWRRHACARPKPPLRAERPHEPPRRCARHISSPPTSLPKSC